MRLGKTVSSMRSKGYFVDDNPERREWLEARDFRFETAVVDNTENDRRWEKEVVPALLTAPIVEVKDVSVGPGALSLPVGLARVVATGANIADAGSMRIGPRDPSLVPILNPPLLFTGQP